MSFGFCEDYHHEYVIQNIVKYTNCQTYLELGIHVGTCFQVIFPLVKRAIGVDIVDNRQNKIGEFYQMTTDKFFEIFKDNVEG